MYLVRLLQEDGMEPGARCLQHRDLEHAELRQPGGGGFGQGSDGRMAHFAGAGLINGPLAARAPGLVVAVFGDDGAGNQHDVFLAVAVVLLGLLRLL
jgi:hypothetical protein